MVCQRAVALGRTDYRVGETKRWTLGTVLLRLCSGGTVTRALVGQMARRELVMYSSNCWGTLSLLEVRTLQTDWWLIEHVAMEKPSVQF